MYALLSLDERGDVKLRAKRGGLFLLGYRVLPEPEYVPGFVLTQFLNCRSEIAIVSVSPLEC